MNQFEAQRIARKICETCYLNPDTRYIEPWDSDRFIYGGDVTRQIELPMTREEYMARTLPFFIVVARLTADITIVR